MKLKMLPPDETSKIPELPDFLFPFDGGSRFEYLKMATAKIVNLSVDERKRHQRKVDTEIRAAIFLAVQIENSPELQEAWCKFEAWAGKNKRPKIGDTSSLLEEVFRLIWAIMQKDQDGYELRLTAVMAVLAKNVPIDQVTEAIREAGGLVAVRNMVREQRAIASSEAKETSGVVHDGADDQTDDEIDDEAEADVCFEDGAEIDDEEYVLVPIRVKKDRAWRMLDVGDRTGVIKYRQTSQDADGYRNLEGFHLTFEAPK